MTIHLVLSLLLVSTKLSSGWECGRADTDGSGRECLCGNIKLTRSDWIDDDMNCCGVDTCYTTTDGDVHCPDGKLCDSDYLTYPWPCGDIRLSDKRPCVCGDNTLTKRDWDNDDKWCCPASPGSCQYMGNGDVKCDGATVKNNKRDTCDAADVYKNGIIALWFCGDIVLSSSRRLREVKDLSNQFISSSSLMSSL